MLLTSATDGRRSQIFLHPLFLNVEPNRMATTNGKRCDLDLRPFIEKIGLRKYLEVVEVGDYFDTVGPKKVVKGLGVERILANLSAEERQQLKELLKKRRSNR